MFCTCSIFVASFHFDANIAYMILLKKILLPFLLVNKINLVNKHRKIILGVLIFFITNVGRPYYFYMNFHLVSIFNVRYHETGLIICQF